MFAYPGTIGYGNCLERLECEDDSFIMTYDEFCKDGLKKINWAMREPTNCLSEDEEDMLEDDWVDCEPCQLGFYEKTLSGGYTKCEQCPPGKITSADMKSCEYCPAGNEAIIQAIYDENF